MATFQPKGNQPISRVRLASCDSRNVKEMRKLAEKFDALELKVKEVAAPFTMKKHSSNRNELLGPSDDRCTVVDIKSTANMENQEIVQLQRNIMKEQDECLDRLEETIVSTKHIALAINEELDLHVRLIDDLDERVEDTSNQLQRAQKKLKSLNTRMRKSGSCTGILVSIIADIRDLLPTNPIPEFHCGRVVLLANAPFVRALRGGFT
ncbi:Syntaxin-51 [Triticum urartu]|uniref:t-SNARE coiled-coil homology domain-containing protein n=2 Tax=Triticum TaxID=4564 RepID=A0A9R0U4B9_TRITD|nr:syntaxin-51-like [Triticum dicoccoides]EMS59036.1 Syntaxin-51 [Triticum urartu]VAI25153.1 unnamed protein product [Triticum turgidum subsp. durum]